VQDYKSLCAAVIVPPWLTHRQIHTQTDNFSAAILLAQPVELLKQGAIINVPR